MVPCLTKVLAKLLLSAYLYYYKRQEHAIAVCNRWNNYIAHPSIDIYFVYRIHAQHIIKTFFYNTARISASIP